MRQVASLTLIVMDASSTAIEREMRAIYRLYLDLARDFQGDSALGGKLVFVGDPDEEATRLLRASNIAGAASLAASADAAALRRTMREGALDFVVTDLDEALRILKNEIRKKLPVAVGVSLVPQTIALEMVDRGVQPDLLGPGVHAVTVESEAFLAHGARRVESRPLAAGYVFCVRSVEGGGQQSAAALEELLLASVAQEDLANRRWLRMAPRYLPASARRLRSVSVPLSRRQL